MRNSIFLVIILLSIVQACKKKSTTADVSTLPIPVVSIIHPTIGNIHEQVDLNGQVVYINKTEIKAPISGYVIGVNVKLGDWVKKGKILYRIQTKESRALQNSKLPTDKGFGIISVFASASGFINAVNISDAGVFVNEGNPMITIVKSQDLTIQVNSPYELSNLIKTKKKLNIILPNKENMYAKYYKSMPLVDAVSQTQQIYLKLLKYKVLPENLNVIVQVEKNQKSNVITLPKDAVLSNETQDEIWIMVVNKDSLAIKKRIKKGIESNNEIEIIEPKLQKQTSIILSGAYGLPDSTRVKIN